MHVEVWYHTDLLESGTALTIIWDAQPRLELWYNCLVFIEEAICKIKISNTLLNPKNVHFETLVRILTVNFNY